MNEGFIRIEESDEQSIDELQVESYKERVVYITIE